MWFEQNRVHRNSRGIWRFCGKILWSNASFCWVMGIFLITTSIKINDFSSGSVGFCLALKQPSNPSIRNPSSGERGTRRMSTKEGYSSSSPKRKRRKRSTRGDSSADPHRVHEQISPGDLRRHRESKEKDLLVSSVDKEEKMGHTIEMEKRKRVKKRIVKRKKVTFASQKAPIEPVETEHVDNKSLSRKKKEAIDDVDLTTTRVGGSARPKRRVKRTKRKIRHRPPERVDEVPRKILPVEENIVDGSHVAQDDIKQSPVTRKKRRKKRVRKMKTEVQATDEVHGEPPAIVEDKLETVPEDIQKENPIGPQHVISSSEIESLEATESSFVVEPKGSIGTDEAPVSESLSFNVSVTKVYELDSEVLGDKIDVLNGKEGKSLQNQHDPSRTEVAGGPLVDPECEGKDKMEMSKADESAPEADEEIRTLGSSTLDQVFSDIEHNTTEPKLEFDRIEDGVMMKDNDSNLTTPCEKDLRTEDNIGFEESSSDESDDVSSDVEETVDLADKVEDSDGDVSMKVVRNDSAAMEDVVETNEDGHTPTTGTSGTDAETDLPEGEVDDSTVSGANDPFDIEKRVADAAEESLDVDESDSSEDEGGFPGVQLEEKPKKVEPEGEESHIIPSIHEDEKLQSMASVIDEHEKNDMADVSTGSRQLTEKARRFQTEANKDDIKVSVVTWNLAESSPSEEDASFFQKLRGSDLVLISGQECEDIKPRRTEGHRSREYRRLMIKMLGKGFVPLALHMLGGIQFGLFVKRKLLDQVEDISIGDVTCGIGNVFHNKGAIGAFLQMKARNEASSKTARAKSVNMLFATAHFAAHVKNWEARDADYNRAMLEFLSQAPPKMIHLRGEGGSSHLVAAMDKVFFCGDLNYRVDLPREEVESVLVKVAKNPADLTDSLLDLLRHDQLLASIAEGRAFQGLTEGRISFLPTFKFDKDTGEYDTSHKQRIPAWTDRILFKANSGTRVLTYDSVPGAQHSDHRPVFATFLTTMQGRERRKKTS